MECPKGLRNGPCGGSTPEKCYVDETRKCVWYEIYRKALRTGREETLLEILPPLDWDKVGTETWGDVIRQVRKAGTGKVIKGLLSGSIEKRSDTWESIFRPVRQPEWWKGDSVHHPSPAHEPASELERKLRNGEFVITTEVTPPLGSDIHKLKQDIELVKPLVTAINFTDNSSACPRMSATACCNVAYKLGTEPVLQIAARDTTRSGLQANIIGANAMGIKNVLFISGDSARIGPSPRSNMNILDIDSVQMLWMARRMKDEGLYLDGRIIKNKPELFIGAATSAVASDPDIQVIRDRKKVNAGAQFLQTNIIFDIERFDIWLENLYRRDILDKVFILVGITPLKSLKMALHLRNNIPGIIVPDKILQRMEKAGPSALQEGVLIASELIESVKNKKGVNGIHLMTFGCEATISQILTSSGVLQGKTVSPLGE
jgi:methylenetetrahydrofolate reductase (NADPH)